MSKGIRPEGRVALIDFFFQKPPTGWFEWPVYVLGLPDYRLRSLPPDATEAVRDACSFIFPGYQRDEQHAYPHLVALRPEPLIDIVWDIHKARGLDPDHDWSREIRLTPAKVYDWRRAILISGDSRHYWPTIDPFDVNWDAMHYDEKLLTLEQYQHICSKDEFAFLRAIGVKIPENIAAE